MGLSRVVVRYVSGRVAKGFTQDFSPEKDRFHLYVDASLSGRAGEVTVREVKAIFFVRDFEGDSKYQERKKYTPEERPVGRKVEVKFRDGEVLVGASLAFDRERKGFFLFPADPRSNNSRVFVVFGAVEAISQFKSQ
jgi:hypothetical protein